MQHPWLDNVLKSLPLSLNMTHHPYHGLTRTDETMEYAFWDTSPTVATISGETSDPDDPLLAMGL